MREATHRAAIRKKQQGWRHTSRPARNRTRNGWLRMVRSRTPSCGAASARHRSPARRTQQSPPSELWAFTQAADRDSRYIQFRLVVDSSAELRLHRSRSSALGRNYAHLNRLCVQRRVRLSVAHVFHTELRELRRPSPTMNSPRPCTVTPPANVRGYLNQLHYAVARDQAGPPRPARSTLLVDTPSATASTSTASIWVLMAMKPFGNSARSKSSTTTQTREHQQT